MPLSWPEACAILDIDPQADVDEALLKKAYKKAALRHHPDKNPGQDTTPAFRRVTEAYQWLQRHLKRGNVDYDEDNDEDNDEYDDDDYFKDLFAAMFFGARGGMHEMPGMPGIRVSFGGPMSPDRNGMGGGYYNRSHRHTPPPRPTTRNVDDILEEMACRARAAAEQKQTERQARQRQQEQREDQVRTKAREQQSRDCWETWTIHQLKGECQRQGLWNRKWSKDDMVRVLVQNFEQEQARIVLKQEAPLLDTMVDCQGSKYKCVDYDTTTKLYTISIKNQTRQVPASDLIPWGEKRQTAAAPKTTKCCAVCQREYTRSQALDALLYRNQSSSLTALPCGHLFCHSCTNPPFLPHNQANVPVVTCRVCRTVHLYNVHQAMSTLVYVQQLREVPAATVMDALVKEYVISQVTSQVQQLQTQHQTALDQLESQKQAALKKTKQQITAQYGGKDLKKKQLGKHLKAAQQP